MQKYWYLFCSSWRDTIFYRSKIIAFALVWLVRVGLMYAVYAYAFQYRGGAVQGMNFQAAIWSIALYFVVFSLCIRRVYKDIADDIYTGTIETKLNKPFHYILYHVCMRLGKGVPHFLLFVFLAFPLLMLSVGFPLASFSLSWLLEVAFLLVLGIGITFLLYSIVGISAVWLTDAEPMYWILDKAVMILGGSYVPVALFPMAMRTVAEFTPFGAATFITHAFNPDFQERWVLLAGVQMMWGIVLFLLLVALHHYANKKLSINGG